jgi:transposase
MQKKHNNINKVLDNNIKNISSNIFLPTDNNIKKVLVAKTLDENWLGASKFINADTSNRNLKLIDEREQERKFQNKYKFMKARSENILKNKNICAIDPGTMIFLTIFTDNSVEIIGKDVINIILKKCLKIDKLIFQINKCKDDGTFVLNSKKRNGINKKICKILKKINFIKEELHNKAIKYLTDNFSKIIISPFEEQTCGKLYSDLAIDNCNLNFFVFLKKLKAKCIEFDITLVIDNEYLTTKTCTNCGNINKNVNIKNRKIECSKCNIIIDRDFNASRNMLLLHNF